jgi:hypothetical protein
MRPLPLAVVLSGWGVVRGCGGVLLIAPASALPLPPHSATQQRKARGLPFLLASPTVTRRNAVSYRRISRGLTRASLPRVCTLGTRGRQPEQCPPKSKRVPHTTRASQHESTDLCPCLCPAADIHYHGNTPGDSAPPGAAAQQPALSAGWVDSGARMQLSNHEQSRAFSGSHLPVRTPSPLPRRPDQPPPQ